MPIPVPGVQVELGGRTLVVPPLTLGAVKRLRAELEVVQTMTGMPNETQVDAMIAVMHAAVQRNYPEVTSDELLELADMRNMGELMNAVMAATRGTVVPADGAPEGKVVGL